MTVLEGYDAARRGAAFFERDARGKIAVAGSDRKAYLHAMLTNDIATLQPGAGCYAAYLTPQGRMITDVRVFEVGDMTLLELRAAEAPTVLEKLDAFIFTEDVKLGDLTDVFAELCSVGPSAAAVVAAVLAAGCLVRLRLRPKTWRGGQSSGTRVRPSRARWCCSSRPGSWACPDSICSSRGATRAGWCRRSPRKAPSV
jgi:glycine cleavage system aminomethyltransferase T